MQAGIKPYPPFGTLLNQAIKLGVKPEYSIYIFCGKDAWQEARTWIKKSGIALCLPADDSPIEYNWIADDLRFVIYDTGEVAKYTLRELALLLLKKGAKSVTIFSEYQDMIELY